MSRTTSVEMIAAVTAGDVGRVGSLLDGDATLVNARGADGYPPLYWAAHSGYNGRSVQNKAMVDLLLARGAELDIFGAAYLAWHEQAEQLLSADPALANARDAHCMTPLHHAAERGATRVARLLVHHRTNVHARDIRGRTPLRCASHPGPWKPAAADEIVELLRAHGAELDIFLAASIGDTERIQRLLAKRPTLVRATDKGGSSALFHAARYLQRGAVELLLAEGADVNARCEQGETALATAIVHAAEHSAGDRMGPLRGVVEALVAAGADLHACDRRGRTPLAHAKAAGLAEIAELLRRHGADD